MAYELKYTLINNDTEYEVSGYVGEPVYVVIPNEYNGKPITSIGASAFSKSTSLTSIIIGNSVTSIGDYAFWDCSSLTSIEIPNSVQSIGINAFNSCDSLTSVTIGESVTSIGGGAFYRGDKSISVNLLSIIPPSISSDTFAVNTKFYCYSSALEKYTSATNWNKFKDNIIIDNLRLYFVMSSMAQKSYFVSNKEIDYATMLSLTDSKHSWTDEQKEKAKQTLGISNVSNSDSNNSSYELIENIIVGYNITTSQPEDWETNYTAYFTNTGTDREPVYTAVVGDVAQIWEAGKYYSYSADGVQRIERNQEPNGDFYNFDGLMVLIQTKAFTANKDTHYAIYGSYATIYQHTTFQSIMTRDASAFFGLESIGKNLFRRVQGRGGYPNAFPEGNYSVAQNQYSKNQDDKIKKFFYRGNADTIFIPSGTTVTVYAKRG